MDSEIIRLEETGMNSWPAENRIIMDGWVANLSAGYSNRSNCVVPLRDGVLPLDEKISYFEALYRSRNLDPLFRVFEEPEQDKLKDFLANRAYKPELRISVQAMAIKESQYLQQELIECDFKDTIWRDYFGDFYGKSESETRGYFDIFKSIILPKYMILKKYHGEVAGCGLGVLDGNMLGVFNVAVKRNLRGKGIGTSITEALIQWGRKMGAEYTWLQVETDKGGPNHMYSKMGFVEIYRYQYMRKGF